MIKPRLGDIAPVERPLRALGFGALYATLLAAVVDASAIPFDAYRVLPSLFIQVPALSILKACQVFLPNLGLAVLLAWCALRPQSQVTARLWPCLGALLAVGGAFWTLTRYEAFVGFPPTWALFSVLLLVVGFCVSGQRLHTWGAGSVGFLRRWGILIVTLFGALVAYGICGSMRVDYYPTLRLSLTQAGHLLALLSLCVVAGYLPIAVLRRLSTPWIALAFIGGALTLQTLGLTATAQPHFSALTTLGTSRNVFNPYSPLREQATRPVPDDPEGVARFLGNSGLPPLPKGFDLTQHNVLFILSEATRFDQTSLADPALATTPELVKLAQSGVYFTRAYAPANCTIRSLSAILGMSYPSMLKVETWQKSGLGEWLEPERSAAVQFSAEGFHTFLVTHSMGGVFSKVMLGLHAGFQDRALLKEPSSVPDTDARIADAAIRRLQDRATSGERFFGLVFFNSPHSPYVSHRAGSKPDEKFSFYRQELEFMDTQLGRVLRALDETGLANRTIVVFAGDHGEEFGEHGGDNHATIYTEVISVPLVIRVPGLEPRALHAPTSIMYVLPWLMLNGSPEMRNPVERILRHELGPMLQATGGAVIAEALGHDRIKSTLIYPSIKVNYDAIADRHEVYRIDEDLFEQHDVFASDPVLAAKSMRQMAAYREVRAARRKFVVRPDKLDPRD